MKIKGFGKQYKNQYVSFNDVNSLKRIVVLKGENGSGKSTILKAMNNIISYQGTAVCDGSRSYMNEQVKFPINMTVSELITAFNYIDQCPREKIVSLIDHYGLSNKINDPIYSLSKGMKMKLQLIITFMIDRDVYYLDEPFSGLDEATVNKLIKWIDNSTKRFIIATHIDVSFKQDCVVIKV